MLDKIKFADHGDATRATMEEHHQILENHLVEFLGTDESLNSVSRPLSRRLVPIDATGRRELATAQSDS